MKRVLFFLLSMPPLFCMEKPFNTDLKFIFSCGSPSTTTMLDLTQAYEIVPAEDILHIDCARDGITNVRSTDVELMLYGILFCQSVSPQTTASLQTLVKTITRDCTFVKTTNVRPAALVIFNRDDKEENNNYQEIINQWPPVLQQLCRTYALCNFEPRSSMFDAQKKKKAKKHAVTIELCYAWYALRSLHATLDSTIWHDRKPIVEIIKKSILRLTKGRYISPQTQWLLCRLFYQWARGNTMSPTFKLAEKDVFGCLEENAQEKLNLRSIIAAFPATRSFSTLCLAIKAPSSGYSPRNIYLELLAALWLGSMYKNHFLNPHACDIHKHMNTIQKCVESICAEKLSPHSTCEVIIDFIRTCSGKKTIFPKKYDAAFEQDRSVIFYKLFLSGIASKNTSAELTRYLFFPFWHCRTAEEIYKDPNRIAQLTQKNMVKFMTHALSNEWLFIGYNWRDRLDLPAGNSIVKNAVDVLLDILKTWQDAELTPEHS